MPDDQTHEQVQEWTRRHTGAGPLGRADAPASIPASAPASLPASAPADGFAGCPAGCASAAYLELLANSAPADAYERPVLRARADGAPPGGRAAAAPARRQARRGRGELVDRPRREAD
ncbi:hypothetical protein ACFVZS_05445, partial [Streptomyces abikoensis]